jgi:hypothetical protein
MSMMTVERLTIEDFMSGPSWLLARSPRASGDLKIWAAALQD